MRGSKAKKLRRVVGGIASEGMPMVAYKPQTFNTKDFVEWITNPETGVMTLEKKKVQITKPIKMTENCIRYIYKQLKKVTK